MAAETTFFAGDVAGALAVEDAVSAAFLSPEETCFVDDSFFAAVPFPVESLTAAVLAVRDSGAGVGVAVEAAVFAAGVACAFAVCAVTDGVVPAFFSPDEICFGTASVFAVADFPAPSFAAGDLGAVSLAVRDVAPGTGVTAGFAITTGFSTAEAEADGFGFS